MNCLKSNRVDAGREVEATSAGTISIDTPILGRFSRLSVFVPVLPLFDSARGTLSLNEPIDQVVARPWLLDRVMRLGVDLRRDCHDMDNKFPQSAACKDWLAERAQFREILRSPAGM